MFKYKINNSNPTFKELHDVSNTELWICATNLTKNKVEYFNYKQHPDMHVNTAIRMSISIPLVMNKTIYNECVYVDGAIKDEFPICPFNNIDKKCIIGIKIDIESNIDINCSMIDYISSIIINMLKRYDETNIGIDCVYMKFSDLPNMSNVSSEELQQMYNHGIKIGKDWLKDS